MATGNSPSVDQRQPLPVTLRGRTHVFIPATPPDGDELKYLGLEPHPPSTADVITGENLTKHDENLNSSQDAEVSKSTTIELKPVIKTESNEIKDGDATEEEKRPEAAATSTQSVTKSCSISVTYSLTGENLNSAQTPSHDEEANRKPSSADKDATKKPDDVDSSSRPTAPEVASSTSEPVAAQSAAPEMTSSGADDRHTPTSTKTSDEQKKSADDKATTEEPQTTRTGLKSAGKTEPNEAKTGQAEAAASIKAQEEKRPATTKAEELKTKSAVKATTESPKPIPDETVAAAHTEPASSTFAVPSAAASVEELANVAATNGIGSLATEDTVVAVTASSEAAPGPSKNDEPEVDRQESSPSSQRQQLKSPPPPSDDQPAPAAAAMPPSSSGSGRAGTTAPAGPSTRPGDADVARNDDDDAKTKQNDADARRAATKEAEESNKSPATVPTTTAAAAVEPTEAAPVAQTADDKTPQQACNADHESNIGKRYAEAEEEKRPATTKAEEPPTKASEDSKQVERRKPAPVRRATSSAAAAAAAASKPTESAVVTEASSAPPAVVDGRTEKETVMSAAVSEESKLHTVGEGTAEKHLPTTSDVSGPDGSTDGSEQTDTKKQDDKQQQQQRQQERSPQKQRKNAHPQKHQQPTEKTGASEVPAASPSVNGASAVGIVDGPSQKTPQETTTSSPAGDGKKKKNKNAKTTAKTSTVETATVDCGLASTAAAVEEEIAVVETSRLLGATATLPAELTPPPSVAAAAAVASATDQTNSKTEAPATTTTTTTSEKERKKNRKKKPTTTKPETNGSSAKPSTPPPAADAADAKTGVAEETGDGHHQDEEAAMTEAEAMEKIGKLRAVTSQLRAVVDEAKTIGIGVDDATKRVESLKKSIDQQHNGHDHHGHEHDHDHEHQHDDEEHEHEHDEQQMSTQEVGYEPVSKAKQSRSEKKARKSLSKMGLKQVNGISQVTIRRKKNVMFIINRPDVFVNSSSETYIIFGEARIEDADERAKQEAARHITDTADRSFVKHPAEGAIIEHESDDDTVDESGMESKDIELVMSQAGVSRTRAIKALKDNSNDIVNAIMALTI